jgi:type II secretory pathway pseudopilin PulG
MRAGETQGGFTLLALLAFMAVTTLGLAAAVPRWSHERQREQERELIRIGTAYALALERYREVSPGTARRFPERLEYLLRDPRFVGTVRHLRRLHDDPMALGVGWQVLRDAQGSIIGVHSGSPRAPLSRAATDLRGEPLPDATSYAQWVFRARDLP